MLSESINYKNFRIMFEKTGTAKYISHLDVSRLFARAAVRAGIKVAHSEGFNPHPKIVFALGLSLGIESFCELVDIRVIVGADSVSALTMAKIDFTPNTEPEILNKLKSVFPPGINIKEVYTSESKFKDIDKTRFHVFVKPNGFGATELEKLFGGDVFVEKKPGININLKDYICNINISNISNISEEFEESGYIKIDAVVKTNQEMFLNPDNIIKGINIKYEIVDYFVQKIEMYDKNFNVFR